MRDDGIIYFHGLNSSPNSDKVAALREHFKEVYAFPIDVDPEVSLPELEKRIDNILIDTINSDKALVFVGTSLGAWYAGRLAKRFYSPAVLINPYYGSGAPIDLPPVPYYEKYDGMGFDYPLQTKFFIDPKDEVLNMKSFLHMNGPVFENLDYMPTLVEGATHRFNGEPFQKVIEFIQNEKF